MFRFRKTLYLNSLDLEIVKRLNLPLDAHQPRVEDAHTIATFETIAEREEWHKQITAETWGLRQEHQ